MIAYIEGKIAEKAPTHCIIACGGLGYLVKTSLFTYNQIRELEQVKLLTFFQVREDAQVLYGFYSLKEKKLFEHLISVSGIGGNTALTILSGTSPQEIIDAIKLKNTNLLKGIKGIGAKTAERIIVELKDKVLADFADEQGGETLSLSAQDSADEGEKAKKSEAVAALVMLGLPRNQVEAKVQAVLRKNPDITLSNLIKEAMRG